MNAVKIIMLTAMAMCYQSDPDCVKLPEIEKPPVQQEGIASYYGSGKASENGMHGRVTATGEPFIPSDQTCASRTIPLNTVVMVESVKTGNVAWCRVNDRGPYGARLYEGGWAAMFRVRGGYVIRRRVDGDWGPRVFYDKSPGRYRGVMDLSFGTAKALDFDFRRGMNPIKIRYYRDLIADGIVRN